MLELFHPLPGLRQEEPAHDMAAHLLPDLFGQSVIQAHGIGLQGGEVGIGALGVHVAGGVPGRAGRQFPALQQDRILFACLCKVIQDRNAHDPAADNDNA